MCIWGPNPEPMADLHDDELDDGDRCDCCGERMAHAENAIRREETYEEVAGDVVVARETVTLWVCDSCATAEERARAAAWKRDHEAQQRAERAGDDDSAFDRARDDDDLPF